MSPEHGGRTRSSTRSIHGRSPTAMATASVTSTGWWPIWITSSGWASTRFGSARSRLADGRPRLRRCRSSRHDPLFGGMPAIERLIAAAHQRGIKITMDVVPTTPVPTCVVSGRAGRRPRHRRAERYYFRNGRGPMGRCPEQLAVGVRRAAWTRVVEPDGNPGQYYLHLFDTEQPD